MVNEASRRGFKVERGEESVMPVRTTAVVGDIQALHDGLVGERPPVAGDGDLPHPDRPHGAEEHLALAALPCAEPGAGRGAHLDARQVRPDLLPMLYLGPFPYLTSPLNSPNSEKT